MTSREHAFVIGGGPAGLVAAIALRRKGLRVTVADGSAAPADKACGEGILPDGVSCLERLGVSLDFSAGHAFDGIRFLNSKTIAEAKFPERPGLGVRRTALHHQLKHAAEQVGVELLWQSPVTGIAGRHVHLGGNRITADWIIGADGYRSRVRQWAGLASKQKKSERFAFRQHFECAPWTNFVEVHWSPEAQLYVTPVSHDQVGVVVLSRNPQLRLQEALRQFPGVQEKLSNAPASSIERGAVTGNASLPFVHKGRVALIGDASGSVDAITGEGLSLSFHQAEALADAISRKTLFHYQATHRNLLRRPTWMARLLLLLEKYSWLQERALQIFAAEPELFRRLLAAHVGHSSPLSFATTSARLGWLLLAA